MILYVLIFTFLDRKLEDKRFCTEWQQACPTFYFTTVFHLVNIIFHP